MFLEEAHFADASVETRLAVRFATVPVSNSTRAWAMSTLSLMTGIGDGFEVDNRRIDERKQDVEVVDHYVVDDVDIEAARRKNAEAMDFEKHWARDDFSDGDNGGIEAFDVADLKNPAVTLCGGEQTTETGWQTGTCSGCIAQDQQGKLFVNVYLTAAKLNWQRTFFYQMFDQTADGSTFGLLVHPPGTTDVIPKLSARYVHNLTSILHDSSSNFEPRPLVYSIAGQSSTIHDLLLEKSDGTYELAVWGDRPVGTLATTVLVDLPTWYPTVNMYDVTIGTAPVARFNDVRTIPLTISDHAVVVEF